MTFEMAALWGALFLEALGLGVVLARIGGLLSLFRPRRKPVRDPSCLVGKNLPALRSEIPARPQERARVQHVAVEPGSFVLFVTVRCVASRRAVDLLAARLNAYKPDFPLVIAVIADKKSTLRFLGDAGSDIPALPIVQEGIWDEMLDSLPFAITIDEESRVLHAGAIDSMTAFGGFIDACGLERVRRWASVSSQTEEFRLLRHD
jgi:hypothetical protein